MNRLKWVKWAWAGAAAAVAFLCVFTSQTSQAQDPSLKPTYGSVKLKAGFMPDPHRVAVEAGGKIKTNLGGVKAWVAKAPDYRLTYTTGKYTLTFIAECKGDATLLINLPDGTWVADDDRGKGLNPRIVLNNPKSGVYDIWIGTYVDNKKIRNATLKITEK